MPFKRCVLLCTGPSKAAAAAGSSGCALCDLIPAGESSEDASKQQPWQQQQQHLAGDNTQQQPGVMPAQQQQERVYAHEHYFHPADNGSYPSRQHLHAALWQDMAISHSLASDPASSSQQPDAAAALAAATDAAQAAPFGWVPDEQCSSVGSTAADAAVRVRPKTAQIRSQTATSMPLEYFDCPEMEQSDLQQRLFQAQAAGAAGLQALSRFYDPQGAFIWAACVVLQYDR
jgi:hypothetical protein